MRLLFAFLHLSNCLFSQKKQKNSSSKQFKKRKEHYLKKSMPIASPRCSLQTVSDNYKLALSVSTWGLS